ncbi:MAG: hypothetical protein NTX25_03635, partial [Proteobacteria bacterium]|nr:hypothetical protein [Pseudomonadota bacterium]
MRNIVILLLLLAFGCGKNQFTSLSEMTDNAASNGSESESRESTLEALDPTFDPMPPSIDPQTDAPWVPITFSSENPTICVEGCNQSIDLHSYRYDSNGNVLIPSPAQLGSIPLPNYSQNGDPGAQNISSIFSRYGLHSALENVIESGLKWPVAMPPSVADIHFEAPPAYVPPIISATSSEMDDLVGAFLAGTKQSVDISQQMAAEAQEKLSGIIEKINSHSETISPQIAAQINNFDGSRLDKKYEAEVRTVNNTESMRKSLSKLPKIESSKSQAQFNTDPNSISGLAVRRAANYVLYTERTLAKQGHSSEEGRLLIGDAKIAISTADDAYATGDTDTGNLAIHVSYQLADAALILSPLIVAAIAPEALVATTLVGAAWVGKVWYEARTGRRISDGAGLSVLDRQMAYLDVGLSMLPVVGPLALKTAGLLSKTLTSLELLFIRSCVAAGEGEQLAVRTTKGALEIVGSAKK